MDFTFYAHKIVLVIKMEPENKKLIKCTVDFELGAEKWPFGPNFIKMPNTDSSDWVLMDLRWSRLL